MVMRGIESSQASVETPGTLRSDRLAPLLRAAVLAYATVLAAPAGAQPPERAPAAAEQPATLEDLEKRIRGDVPALDDDRFITREEATSRLLEAVNGALRLRNPLPPSLLAPLDPRAEHLSPEQRARLRHIHAHAERSQMLLPGRTPCPVKTDTPVPTLLSAQFSLPVTATDPEGAAKMADDREGHEGQTSADALLRLCQRHGCVPELTQAGIELRPAEGATMRATDDLFLVERKEGTTVFHLPDRGTLLTGFSSGKGGAVKIAPGGFPVWSEGNQGSPEPYLELQPKDGAVDVLVGVSPMTQELDLAGLKIADIGPQSFRVMDVVRQEDGTWVLNITGLIYPDLPWPKTTVTEDMYTYQLAASTRFTVRLKDGREMLCAAERLEFRQRQLSLQLRIPDEPASVRVRGFRDMDRRTLPLP